MFNIKQLTDYSPGAACQLIMVRPAGLESATSRVEVWRSVQLSYGRICAGIALFWAKRSLLLLLLRLFFCLPVLFANPQAWAAAKPDLAVCSGNLTPPRISPAFAGLWLGRGIIVGGCCHGETGCQTCFCLDGYTLVTLLAVVYAKTRTGGPGASDARSLIR